MPDARLCTSLIKVASSHGQGATALGIYEWMRAKREEGGAALQGTVHTYTVAMRAALAANMLPQALKVRSDLAISTRTIRTLGVLRTCAEDICACARPLHGPPVQEHLDSITSTENEWHPYRQPKWYMGEFARQHVQTLTQILNVQNHPSLQRAAIGKRRCP